MVSPGENYPVGNVNTQVGIATTAGDNYGVVSVAVVNPGLEYSTKDIAFDNFGNQYTLTVNNGNIVSAQVINTRRIQELPTITVESTTGRGAVLKPILGKLTFTPPAKLTRVIDCPT